MPATADEARSADAFGAWPLPEYLLDAWQRSILFLDAMRQRGDIYLDHRRAGKPPVLRFPYEMLVDGRTLERPVNYALLRILPDADVPTDAVKRPFVIVDPRAGHGPGIGGYKADSQVGIALRAGHAVYFVTFFQEPEPGQTLRDIAEAEAHFLETVAERHPEAVGRPCVIGNCQAGWAVAALASVRPELVGPIVLNGAPLSYWSGVRGGHPMRYIGGLLGGKWLATLSSDLGNGVFDGANIVANFEHLNPANTLWTKYRNLYANIDTEVPRFLDFERWWGGFFLLNAEEMDAIVSQLFVGNKLARGDVVTADGIHVDLKNIKSPIIVFASFGDNITPPQQALNWIVDLYGSDEAILDDEQTIVYVLHEDVGHLGIFVSGRVARKEHAELLGTLELIDRMPPGLSEMIIEQKPDDLERGDLVPGDYTARFEMRTLDDILAIDDDRDEERMFQSVAQLSDINDAIYRAWVQPWVRAMSSAWSAELCRHLHLMRVQRYTASSLNPWLAPVAAAAPAIREARRPVAEDDVFRRAEHAVSEMIVASLDAYRDVRDAWGETWFSWLYSPWCLGAVFPPTWSPGDPHETRETPPDVDDEPPVADEAFESGGFNEAIVRMFLLAARSRRFVDRRSMLIVRELRARGELDQLEHAERKRIVAEQAALLRRDEERAIRGLAQLLPTREDRERAASIVRTVLMIDPEEMDYDHPLVRKIAEVLELELERCEPELIAPGAAAL